MNRTLVIGATGTVGRHVVSQLVDAGVPVRAVARHPEAARLPVAVEVVRGDLTAPETLDECLTGVDSVFLVWVVPPATAAPLIQRIAKKTRKVVFLSAPFKTPHPLFQQPNPAAVLHAQIEQHIERSGLEWTILRPGMFAGNALGWWAPQIRDRGVVRWPYLSVPTAPIDQRDIAAVAVRALLEQGHAGAEYVLTGPESLTQREQLAAISRAIGRTFLVEEISPDDAPRELAGIMPPPVVTMLLNAWAAAMGQPALVTSTVADVTGSPARSFLSWAIDHTDEFQARQGGASSRS